MPRNLPPRLELLCLRALWTLGEGNVTQVRELINQTKPLAYTTVMTLLDRLSRKGAVARRKQGRAFLYSAVVSRESIRSVAVRELVANALIHQDFSITGAGPMVEIFEGRIEVTNPGEPLVATDRFLDSPPKSRNESLASLMRRFRICEERGSGIDKVVSQIELYQLPPPLFEVPPGSTRRLST